MYMAISTFEPGPGYRGTKPYRHAFDAYRGISTRMGIPIYNSYPVVDLPPRYSMYNAVYGRIMLVQVNLYPDRHMF